MDKIFIFKEEGKDINSITRARPAMAVDERVAVATVEVPFSGRTESSSIRLLPVVAGRAAGYNVDNSCAKGGCHQRM